MTKFKKTKFCNLLRFVKNSLCDMMSCRGPEFTGNEMDMWFRFLCLLRNGASWHYNASMFSKKPSTFEKGMLKVMEATHDALIKD